MPSVETFRGATEPFQQDLPPWPRPPLNTSPQPWFRPDFDLISAWFGPAKADFRVQIRSKSGPSQVWGEGVCLKWLCSVRRVLCGGPKSAGPKRGSLNVGAWNLQESRKRAEYGFGFLRFQTPNSVSFSGLTEFRGANSVSSSQPIICVPKRTHRVFRRTHRVCRKTQWVLSSETVLSKQYSARFLESVS